MTSTAPPVEYDPLAAAPHGDAARLASGAGVALLGRVAGRLIHLVVQVVIARGLGVETFGLYAIGWTTVRIGGLIAPLGLEQGVLRYGSIDWDGDRGRLRTLLLHALGLALLAGLIIGAALYLAAPLLAHAVFRKPELSHILRWFAPAFALIAGLRVAAAATRLSRTLKWSVYAEELGQPGANLLLLLLFAALGWGLFGAVAATVVSFAVGLALALTYVHRLLPGSFAPVEISGALARRLLAFSVPVSLAGVCTALLMWSDVLMVGHFLPTADVGIYQAAASVSMLFSFILGGFVAIFAPMIGELFERREMARLQELYRLTTKWTLYLTVPLYLAICFASRELMVVVFGSDFAPGAWPLIILATGQLANVAMGTVGLLLVMTGWHARWLLYALLMLVVALALNWLLIPRFGLVGAAVATAVSLSALFLLGLMQVKRALGIWPYDRRCLKLVLPTLLVGVMGALMRAVGPFPPIVTLALSLLAALTIFAIGLAWFGLDREDHEFLQRLRAALIGARTRSAASLSATPVVESVDGGSAPRADVPPSAKRFRVLGVQVDAVQIPDVVARIDRWVAERQRCHMVAVTSMHGVMEAQDDATFKAILNSADLTVPDGMPLVWLGRRQGHALPRRVYGPELMQTCLESGAPHRHFFLGAGEGVAERLAAKFRDSHQLLVVGTYCPPFDAAEDVDVVALINRAAPDVLWVALGTPKQERWMAQHRDKLDVPVVLGVGAAFDFLAGVTAWAPPWMRENGLEWLFRLISEPRRLWRRYVLAGSRFVWRVLLEQTGLARFE
jgi:exopolysaccharide biosynthesis WecB/TagA/CpsF family protein